MVGIGIVGIGFMGMIHYLAAAKAAGRGSSPCAVATPRSWPETGRASRAISGRAAARWTSPAWRCTATSRPCSPILRSTWSTSAFPTTPTAGWPFRRSRPASTSWSRSRSPSRSAEADRDGGGRRGGRQAAHGRPRLAVLPRVCLRPRGRPVRPLRSACGRPI